MNCFLFTLMLSHFRPRDAVCEHLHTCGISTVQTRASGMVWRSSYDLFCAGGNEGKKGVAHAKSKSLVDGDATLSACLHNISFCFSLVLDSNASCSGQA